MRIYFSTVLRNAPPLAGGELVSLDWEQKRVLARTPIAATNPTLDDPNPRGNTRGGRGLRVIRDEIFVCSYHTVRVFDRDLVPLRDLSHPLMVGLHEVDWDGGQRLWLTPTAIDAAIELDLESGKTVGERWPRELPGFQAALDIEPLEIDKSADNRGRFLAGSHLQNRGHLHLNAVALHHGEVLALFNRYGVIANLDQDRILVRHKRIRRGHNLVVGEDGLAWVNDTAGRHVECFDLATGKRVREIDLMRFEPVAALARPLDRVRRVKVWLHKRGVLRHSPPRPIFVRGLTRHEGSLFVGISPSTILQIDEASGELVDHYTYQRGVHACIHGLQVVGS